MSEATTFTESAWLRNESVHRFNMQRTDLLKRKEKLFKGKDVSKWACPPEKLHLAMEALNDAETAFSYMLPNATQQVNYLEEESNYFSTQVWKESRRTVMMDYSMAREVFVDVGEQMQRHLYEVNNGWGQFLDFYTDLNNARKENDDTFVEKNYIGEELVEPDENNPVHEDLFDHYEKAQELNNNSFVSDDNVSEDSVSLLRGKTGSQQHTPKDSPNILAELKRQINQEEESKEVSSFDTGSGYKAPTLMIDTNTDKRNQIEEDN